MGRVTGDDPGDVAESGAERRAEAERQQAEQQQQQAEPGGSG